MGLEGWCPQSWGFGGPKAGVKTILHLKAGLVLEGSPVHQRSGELWVGGSPSLRGPWEAAEGTRGQPRGMATSSCTPDTFPTKIRNVKGGRENTLGQPALSLCALHPPGTAALVPNSMDTKWADSSHAVCTSSRAPI